jgi:subtilisin family serine protease
MTQHPRSTGARALRLLCAVLLTLGVAGIAGPAAAQTTKTRVTRQADLPPRSYPVAGTAMQLVESDGATFDAFAAKVRSDIDAVLANYEIEDRPMLRELLGALLDLQELAGEYAAALQTVETLRSLEDKPASRLLSGLFAKARLQAALDVGSIAGPDYEQAFRTRYQGLIAPLPWDVTQDAIKGSAAAARLNSRASTLGRVASDLEPAVAKSAALEAAQAWTLIGARANLKLALPVSQARADVLREYIARHDAPRPDIWAARDVTLGERDRLMPVNVAIWDSGVDVSLFPDQLFTDRESNASGRHGLAFDDLGNPSTDWLYPITAEERNAYPEFRDQIEGLRDLQRGIDSREALAVQKRFASYSPEQMHAWIELTKPLGHYIHGTHCAGIAVRGNPAARLVVARFNDQLALLSFQPNEAWARRMGAAFQQMADYFRTRDVRVVNMSWSDTAQEIETWLTKTGGGADPEQRKGRAAAIFAIWRNAIESAIKSAPGTLFVAAAGNSNNNAAFIESVPASLRLPNLITVGAVNQAGDETSFTSSGDSVVVHANGYQVESFVPGGTRLRLSGTSMAAPNVANLAAKLFALDPMLTPTRAIELIRAGATTSDDGRRHLIDPKRTVALLKAPAG